ncbi:hypothetical protein K438DRAFT_1580723 [Mycena galopus ATCC 62051]|nr:hypothetical protein K438DRAFT_1580723 [Mycena galopus ATCC 62051]
MPRKFESRKYIDLIQTASSKWANWDPPHPIKVGDYGTINAETGEFEKDGNIYEDASTAVLAASHPPETAVPDEKMIIVSDTAQNCEFSLGPHVNVPGIADASIKGRWKFKAGKTGALLVMAQPRSSFLPTNALLKLLVNIPALGDKHIVTEIVSCYAYSMYLSSRGEDEVSLALMAKTPIAITPLVSAGGEIGGSWWSETGAGVFRHGFTQPGTYSFTPLFVLKRVRKKVFFRMLRGGRGGAGGSGVPQLMGGKGGLDVKAPWEPLDEDGEELESLSGDDGGNGKSDGKRPGEGGIGEASNLEELGGQQLV